MVRLSKESGMQKTRLISLDCHLPYLIKYSCLWKNTGLKKLIRVRVIFIICLKLIIVDMSTIINFRQIMKITLRIHPEPHN